jgi:hypothetical protein
MASYPVEEEDQSYLEAVVVGDQAREADPGMGSDLLVEKIQEEDASMERLEEEEEGEDHKVRIEDQNVVIGSVVVVGACPFGIACWPPFRPEMGGFGQLGR